MVVGAGEVQLQRERSVYIKKYTLEKYVPAKSTEQTLEVIFKGGEQLESLTGCIHGQEKCTNLIFPFARSEVAALPIKEARTFVEAANEIEDVQTKQIQELTLDITDTASWDFQPGDTIGILPRNSELEVQKLLQAMQLDDQANHNCQLRVLPTCTRKAAKVPTHIPSLSTPRELLRDCLNIRAVLKKQFLSALATCCIAPEERAFLASLSSKEGSTFYNELILEKGFTLLELLETCASCRPTLGLLVEHLPRLMPRPYSVANSPLAGSNEIKIIFSILPQRPGVTTKMLQQLALKVMEQQADTPSPKVLAYLRDTNQFRYTAEEASTRNQLLISIGTGLAPFLGFLEHKQRLAAAGTTTRLGETWLFAGAATAETLLQRDRLLELQAQAESGAPPVLNRYFESLSRVADAPFHYVQQQLEDNAYIITRFFMRPETTIYVCADGAQISKSIEETIIKCIAQNVELPESVPDMIKHFKASGKYREDVWT